jgi:hypothetical protein
MQPFLLSSRRALLRCALVCVIAYSFGASLSVPLAARDDDEHGCPNWECEGGTECHLNTGGNTGCVMLTSSCKTIGCPA